MEAVGGNRIRPNDPVVVLRIGGDQRPLPRLSLLLGRLIQRAGADPRAVLRLAGQMHEQIGRDADVEKGIDCVLGGHGHGGGTGEAALRDVPRGSQSQSLETVASQTLLDLGAQVAAVQRAHGRDGVAHERERAAHVAADPQGGGRQRPAVFAPLLQFLVTEVPQGQEQSLAHAGAKLLVRVQVAYVLARIHDVVVGRDGVDALAIPRVRGEQVNPAVIRFLGEDNDLLVAGPVAGPDGHLPGRTVEADHVRVHESDAQIARPKCRCRWGGPA